MKLIGQVLVLNVFDSESNDSRTIHRERLTTRWYLFILFLSLYSITIYSMFSTETTNVIISHPNESVYSKYIAVYSTSLQCPCDNISVKYRDFISINTISHAICASYLVRTDWRDYLFVDYNWFLYYRADLRSRGAVYFSFLSTLCQLSETTVKRAIDQFLNETFINTQVISKTEFYLQVDNFISQFKQTTTAQFSRNLNLLRDVMSGNALISSYVLNYDWPIDADRTYTTIPVSPVRMKNGCSCGTRNDCNESGGVYYYVTDLQEFAVPGWNVGCSIVETLLRSTMECFYNSTCI